MGTVPRRLDSFPPGYCIEVDGVHAGDVFKTEHPYYPSIPIWYAYLPGQDLPLDPTHTRTEAVDNLAAVLARTQLIERHLGVESRP